MVEAKHKEIMRMTWASNHSGHERQTEDYYATDPIALDSLFHYYPQLKGSEVREPACWEWHLSKVMMDKFLCNTQSSDLVNRWYGKTFDFLDIHNVVALSHDTNIITNPPYSKALEFIQKSFEYEPKYICMFLRLQFIEWFKRHKELFSIRPPETIIAHSKRIKCAMNWDFKNTGSSAVAYARFVWSDDNKKETKLVWY
jgi:hypothetical protein